MANKKLEVSVNSGLSEIVLTAVCTAAGIAKNSAEVVRDASGKVIKVLVNLPENAAAAAATAISANSGVAAVEIIDIPEGYAGADGTQESLDALIAAGYRISQYGVTYTPGNIATIVSDNSSPFGGIFGITGDQKLPAVPLDCALESKLALTGEGDRAELYIHRQSRAGIRIRHTGSGTAGELYVDDEALPFTPVAIANVGAQHTYKIVRDQIIAGVSSVVTVYLDGSQVYTHISPQGYTGRNIVSAYYTPGTAVELDYVKWTER